MEYLFVGGDYDGERFELLQALPEARLLRRSNAPVETREYNDSKINSASYLSYKREELYDADGLLYAAYFHGNPAQPLRMLLEGYGNAKRTAA